MQVNEIIWENTFLNVYCAEIQGDCFTFRIKNMNRRANNARLTYNKGIDFRWDFRNYSYIVDSDKLKTIVGCCPNLAMFDFSDDTQDLSHSWCEYIKKCDEGIGHILDGCIPWPFVPAMMVLLMNEIYDEGV